jgi:hypothetical protein
MIEQWNLEFAGLLEQAILLTLHGDQRQKKNGLYRDLMACQTMDDFSRAKGVIQGYENVLEMMRDVARKMNERDETQAPMRVRAN